MLTVIEPPASFDLTTIDAVKEELGFDSGVSDALLTDMIARASAQVRTICDRDFGLARVRQYVTAHTTGGYVVLKRYPVGTIHAVVVDGRLLESTEYVVADGILSLTSGRWGRFASLVVEYSAGYVLPGEEGSNLPADIEAVAIALTRQMAMTSTRDPSIRSESFEGIGSVDYFASGSSANGHAAMLAPYRMPVAI